MRRGEIYCALILFALKAGQTNKKREREAKYVQRVGQETGAQEEKERKKAKISEHALPAMDPVITMRELVVFFKSGMNKLIVRMAPIVLVSSICDKTFTPHFSPQSKPAGAKTPALLTTAQRSK